MTLVEYQYAKPFKSFKITKPVFPLLLNLIFDHLLHSMYPIYPENVLEFALS